MLQTDRCSPRGHCDSIASCTYIVPPQVLLLELCIVFMFQCRMLIHKLQNQLTQNATQYRAIQKRLLTKLKDKTPSPLTNLDVLLESTHHDVCFQLHINNVRVWQKSVRHCCESCIKFNYAAAAWNLLVSFDQLLLNSFITAWLANVFAFSKSAIFTYIHYIHILTEENG